MSSFTVRAKGKSLDQLMAATVKDLTEANRTAGKEIRKVGRKAIREKAPKVGGKKLGARINVKAYADRADVTFRAHTVGGWMMHEKGAKPHDIYPRKGRVGRAGRPAALSVSGLYAANVWHPGTKPGTKAWTKAIERVRKAILPAIVDVYDDALGN